MRDVLRVLALNLIGVPHHALKDFVGGGEFERLAVGALGGEAGYTARISGPQDIEVGHLRHAFGIFTLHRVQPPLSLPLGDR